MDCNKRTAAVVTIAVILAAVASLGKYPGGLADAQARREVKTVDVVVASSR